MVKKFFKVSSLFLGWFTFMRCREIEKFSVLVVLPFLLNLFGRSNILNIVLYFTRSDPFVKENNYFDRPENERIFLF